MKKTKLLTSLIALFAVTVTTSCQKGKSESNSNSDSTSSSGATGEYVLGSVDAKHEFVLFNQNKSKDSSKDDGFYDHTQSFKVGDDNNFNVKPELTVVDAVTFQVVEHEWDYDFTITATVDGQNAGKEYFSVVDARKCDVKFTEAAIGKNFTITVTPGGVTEAQAEKFKKSVTVEVVDGYNVYNAKELGYFDTREKDSTVDAPTMEDGNDWQCKWYDFKQQNGLNPDLHPTSLIFQTNIKVTAEDLPSNYFYTKKQAQDLNDTKAEGSLVDYIYLYMYTGNENITVDGNYFSLDFSEIPLIKRESCKTTGVGEVVGHSAIFKSISGKDVTFQNINMSGNARNAINDEDRPLSGGLIFVKGAGCERFNATNIIATKFYITFFGEEPFTENGNITAFHLDKAKCYNNYNSFLYSWGSNMDISNSLFRGCGGPVTIQDHTSTNEYEKENGMVVLGNAPTTNFVDCTFVNYVAGEEAWFQQFGATALVNNIKSMSDLLLATGLPKVFVTNKEHVGKSFKALSAADQPSFFNFIALNKSGSTQGMTAEPVCGTVNIVETGKATTFNYLQPAYDAVYQAYVAYQTAVASGASAEEQAAAQQALGAACVAKGVEPTEEGITAYLTALCTEHMTLRGLNNASAPVFDLGSNFHLLSYDGNNPFLQLATTVAAEAQGGAPAQFVPTADQLAAMPNYTSLYYNGMGLTFQLANFVA